MRRFVTLFSLLAAALAAPLAHALTEVVNGIEWNYSIHGNGSAIIKGLNASSVEIKTLKIPSKLGGAYVTQIAPSAFSDYTSLTSVEIPFGVSSIGAYAFTGCTSLTSIEIPATVSTIEAYTFSGCVELESAVLPEGLVSIGMHAFSECLKLESAPIPESVTTIGDYAFYRCLSLKSAKLSNNVTKVGSYAFADCWAIDEIVIPKQIKKIGDYAFACGSDRDLSLTIEVAQENVSLGSGAFDGVQPTRFVSTWVPDNNGWFFPNLKEIGVPEGMTELPNSFLESMLRAGGVYPPPSEITTVILPSTLRYVEREAFEFLSPTIIEAAALHGNLELPKSATTLRIPTGTKEIAFSAYDSSAISDYPGIYDLFTEIIIPEGVEAICGYAFSRLDSVKSFNLPASVKTIEDNVFPNYKSYGACKTEEITVDSGNEWYTAIGNVLYTRDLTQVIYAAPAANIGTLVLPSTVTSILANAFKKNQGITSITIPRSVTTIDYETFRECKNLCSVVLPEGLQSIQQRAFYDCEKLETINLPTSLEKIGDEAFQGCVTLKSIKIPDNVNSIGSSAFSGCTKVKTFHLPASVSTMPLNAFPLSWNMESLTVADGNPLYFAQDNILYNKERTEILLVACKGVSGEIVIPEGVTHLDSYLFSRCENLTSITLPVSLASMGDSIFAGCSNLQKIHFMGKVPEGFSMNTLYGATITYEDTYADAWQAAIAVRPNKDTCETKATVTVACEPVGTKQLRVRYTIHSDLPKAKVRAVAFQDGVRSFANFVPVRTGDGVPYGEEVSTNEEHTFMWDVTSDWNIDLAKVNVEILVQEGGLLPQHLQVIPTSSEHRAMTITLNYITPEQAKNALLWCLAEGDPALELKDGKVYFDGSLIATGNGVVTVDAEYPGLYPTYGSAIDLLRYLYGRMGCAVIEDEDLSYAEHVLRRQLHVVVKESFGNRRTINTVAIKIEEGE